VSSSGFRCRRRPSAAQADGAAVQAPSPPSLPVFFFTNGDTVAPARCRSPRTTAARGFSPASCASFLPPTPSPPPSDLVEAADSGGIPKAVARRTGRPADRGWGFIGRRLGFGARERAAGIRFRGAWRPSGGASAAGKGRRPWGRRGSPPAPRPHGVRHGENNREIRIRPDRLGPHVSGCGVWLW
jgi:hypothetical protein